MTCELTKVNGRAINSALNKQVLSNQIIPERVANSLREIFSDKYVIDAFAQQALKEHILKWANSSLKMPFPDTIKQKINVIKDNVDSIVAIATSQNQSQNEPKTNTQMQVLDQEHFEVLEQVEYSMLNQLYGTAQQARTEMQNTLRTNVIASMFVNFDEGYVVKDIEHLNKNITNFQERLYQTILQYAKLKGRSTSDTNLFVDGKFMNPKNLRVLADQLFSDFNGAKLNDLFANRALANEGLALRAYNAWVILNNFDMLLKNLLGKTIVINENYKGTFQDASKLKYQLSGESNLVKTWRTSEDVNAINELGSITKLLVESAPIYKYNKSFGLEDQPDEQLYGQTLELKDVMFAFAQAQEHPDLKNMHMQIRYNPMLYIPMFIQSALEVTYGNNDQQIKNILYSVYKRFFQLQHKDIDTQYSLAQIMNSESAKADYNVSNNLLSYITGMIDKTVPNNHLEYAIDSDTGFITTRYSSMNSLNTSKIMVQKTINNINDVLNDEDRDRLLERFKISQITDNPQVKTQFQIEFEQDGTQYYIKFDNRKGELKFIEFDIVTNAGRQDYPKATGRTNDLEYKAKQALINLLDSTLHMSLAQRPELLDQLYDILPTTDPNMDKQIDSLLQLSLLAGRVLLKHEIDRGKYDDYKIDEMYGTDSNRYRKDWLNQKTGKILSVLNERQSGELITKLAQAQMSINGDIAKSTVRNLEGNQVAAEGLTNLINTVKTVWNDAHQQEDSANKFCIFAQHADLLNRVAIKSAAQSSDRLSVKSDRDFNVGESGYTAIMLDFLTGYAKQMVGGQYTDGRGLMQFQPTVYSDKTTNCVLVIDGNTFIQEFNKKFINLTPEEVKQYHFSTMSDMYNQLKQNITRDYQLFFDAISHTPVLETSLRASGIDPNDNYTYEQFRDIIFPIINEFANGEYTAGTPFEGKSAVQVFDSIVKPTSKVVVNVHYAGKKNLETNPVLDYHFMMYNKTDDSLYRQQVAKYQAKFAKHCLQNFRINWKNDRLEVDPKLKGAVARLGINETTYVSNWVDSKTGELIIAKTTDGRPLTRLDAESNFPENVELNPILDAFYSFDQIISTQFITSTVGGCYGHKNNFKSTNLTPGTLEYMEEEEAGRTLTQFKRMVIYPATMHNYQQELIEGCATKIKVAAIADIQAQVYNFLDAQDDIDAHDGSGFCLPWVSDWENGSLGESAAGEDKKTIGHSMDGKYLMESEFKWALFSLTNERIRNAGRVSGVNLKQLVRKMGDLAWNTQNRPFDFTKDPLGNTINLTSFGKGVFFRAEDQYLESPQVIPGHFYKVLFVSSSDTPNQYNIQLIEVNSQGQAIMPEAFMVQKLINSNYKLWEAFGAEYSMELYTDATGESSLINSNSSSQLVAFYGNRAGYLRSQESEGMYKDVEEHPDHEFFYEPNTYSDDPTFKTDAELRANRALWTQRDVYQPMKYSDISYAVNPSAIKNGQTNVNPRSSWYDDTELTSFWISTKHFGVQMDADHHADDAELTEMSQVISALESNGYTHHIAKEAYRDLGAIVYAQLKPYMQAIEQHYKGDGRALYEVVGKAFLDSFQNSSSNRSDLADALVYNLKQKLGNGDSLIDAEVWIPFSDTTVLSKLISTITSQINKSAIKRKYAGIASVMVPAYDLIKIYKHQTPDGRTIDATYGGMVNTIGTTDGVKQHLDSLTENSPVLTKWDLELGKSYINLNTGERFTINTLDQYYELRSFAAPDPIQYKEDFTQGRNLQPARTTYQLEDMEGTYDIYDVDAVTNKLRFSKWYSGYKKASDKVQYLINSLQQLQNISDIANNENVDRVLQKMYNTGDSTKLDFYVKQIGQFLQQDIVTAFHNLHEESFVVIDGQIHYVKEGTLQQQEAELVLSKIYATKFGLKPGTYLNDINEKFFQDQIRSLLAPKNEQYGIALKKANGRHTYIISNTKEEIQRLINFGYIQQDPPVRITENGTFRTDSETGEIIGPFNDCQLYVSSNGDEIIVTDDVQQFLDNDDYESIQVNANNSPEMYVGILTTLDSDLVEAYKQPYNEQLLVNIAKNEEKVIARAARRKWTSFQKSLEFTAARIPSQSMQSFMPMKVVGFTDSDENKAYVSHFQTFLQGSDYKLNFSLLSFNSLP